MEKKQLNVKLCDSCGENATCLCFECLEYFCESCFKSYHEKKLKSQHKKENIDPYIPFDLKCPLHPNVVNNLFCTNEKSNIYNYLII